MPFTIGPKAHNVARPALKDLIEEFFSLRDWEGLYLTGGTCLAEYYFGHRLSVDIDLFTLEQELFQDAARALTAPGSFRSGRVEVVRRTPNFLQCFYHPNPSQEPVKVDLVLDASVHLSPPVRVGAVWIDSLEDILSNKMGCLISRNEVKDYVDLFYLIPASHLTAKELLELGLKKEGGLDPVIMAHQMEFVFREPVPAAALLGKIPWEEFKLFFRKFQKECLDLIRPKD